MRVVRADLHDTGEIHRHRCSDVGDAEAVARKELAIAQTGVESSEKLAHPRAPALGQFRYLRIVDRPRQGATVTTISGTAGSLSRTSFTRAAKRSPAGAASASDARSLTPMFRTTWLGFSA